MQRAILISVIIALIACSASADNISQKQFDVKQGQALDMYLKAGGSIVIGGWDEDRIFITADFVDTDGDKIEVEYYHRKSGLEIVSYYNSGKNNHNSRVDFDIKVPKYFDLDIHTTGGGIVIRDLEGELIGKTNGGHIKLTDCDGYMSFTANGGTVEIRDIKGQAYLDANGGDVECYDSNFKGKVRANGGRIYVDNNSGGFECLSNDGHELEGISTTINIKSSDIDLKIKRK